ncbi:hypothetical protein DV736_g1744, partial [Chaetothyriales sp. CBS 134916]
MAVPSTAVAKRPLADAALMPPPPPIKKIKRPASVLDEDDYTDALSDIIARDYFPGLQENNASFNDVLDKQNATRRNKHAYLWTADQRIPTQRLLLHRAKQQQLISQHAHDDAAAKSDGREIVPLTTGSTDSRPAQPDTWKSQSPANSLMFSPASVDQDGLATQQEDRERKSKAGPKAIVLENTRFPPLHHLDDSQHRHSHASSPSLNTDIINSRRELASTSAPTISAYPGGETPHVNGYAFPSYRDLLAGQAAGDETPNPFKLSSARRRELLHHKLVDEAKRKKKRTCEMQPRRMSGSQSAAATPGNMTPAARKLLERLAKTPARGVVKREHE